MIGVLSVTVAACGSSPRVAVEDRTAVTTQPSTAEPDALSPAEAVGAASRELATARAYRVTTSSAQVLEIAALNAHTVQELDPSRPTTSADVAANGVAHIVIDLGPILGPLMSGNPEAAAAIDSAHVELWTTPELIYIDATGYQPIADLNPTADLGPFAPGLGVIDLARFGEASSDDLLAALVGSGVPDPTLLATSLPAALDAVAADPARPRVFTATATYATLLEAVGNDVDDVTHATARPIANALGIDEGHLADFYERFYRSTNCDVTITVGPDDVLSSLEFEVDLSSIFEQMFDPDDGLDIGTDATSAQARTMFDGAVWRTRVLTTFDLDDSITVAPPVGDFEDRTDVAIQFLG